MFDLGGTIGGLLFIRLVAPQGLKLMGAREAHAVEGRCFRLVRVSLATALFALLGWLALEASDMSRRKDVGRIRRAETGCHRRGRSVNHALT